MTAAVRSIHARPPGTGRALAWFSPLSTLLAWFALAGASPLLGQLPTPASVIGFELGSDHQLADYTQITEYLQALDRASDRVMIEEIGRSTLDRPLLLLFISDPANLRNRTRLKEISRRLANAEDPDRVQAERLAAEGKAVVWIDGGLHATEVAHGQFTPELAYWLASDESEEARRIRREVILLLMPNMNPDGLDIVVDWYRQNVGTEFETAPVPELYHHYIGHDNNRDWYMFTQAETRAVGRQLYHEWFPQIVYNHHQSGPFPGRIWVPPFENPVNPNLDPFIVTSINHLGEAMKRRFAREGKPGVSSGIVYDMWWNGSMRGAPDFHNMLGFLTETALYRYATPYCYDADEIPENFSARAGNLPAKRPTTQYPDPWLGGCWHLKDPMEYMMTASRAVLDQASRFKEDYLLGIYDAGRRQIDRGQRAEGGPFAYVIDPERQHDPSAAVDLIRTLRMGGIEIRRTDARLTAGGVTHAPGSWVIGPQAFRPFVVDLMEPKTYPDRRQYPGGPPDPPYDMTGYELSLQMGVEATRVTEPFELPETLVDSVSAVLGSVEGEGQWGWALERDRNTAVLALNRLAGSGSVVTVTRDPMRMEGRSLPAGTFLIRRADFAVLGQLARDLGVVFHRIDDEPSVRRDAFRSPRVGLFRSHMGNMPEGWTRWLLEQYDFDFENIGVADVRGSSLDRFHVIILPDESLEDIRDGYAPDQMPPRYVGGIGAEGMERLRAWVERGGVLLALDQAVDLAIQTFELPVVNRVADASNEEFFIPGSLLWIDVDPFDPVALGMAERAAAFFVRSQVLEVIPPVAAGADGGDGSGGGDGGQVRPQITVFARYAEEPLASGWALGADRFLAGHPAGLRARVGRGEVVLIGFEPHFRGQPRGTYKLLFNPLLRAGVQRQPW